MTGLSIQAIRFLRGQTRPCRRSSANPPYSGRMSCRCSQVWPSPCPRPAQHWRSRGSNRRFARRSRSSVSPSRRRPDSPRRCARWPPGPAHVSRSRRPARSSSIFWSHGHCAHWTCGPRKAESQASLRSLSFSLSSQCGTGLRISARAGKSCKKRSRRPRSCHTVLIINTVVHPPATVHLSRRLLGRGHSSRRTVAGRGRGVPRSVALVPSRVPRGQLCQLAQPVRRSMPSWPG